VFGTVAETPQQTREGLSLTASAAVQLLLWVGLHACHLLWATLWQFGFLVLAVMVIAALMAGTKLEDGELRSGVPVEQQWADVLHVLRLAAGEPCQGAGAEWIREHMAAQVCSSNLCRPPRRSCPKTVGGCGDAQRAQPTR
jgi:hypothetical protein